MRLIAHLLCVPVCFVALNLAVSYSLFALCDRMQWDEPPAIFIIIPFVAYYFVPSIFGVIYLGLCLASLVAVWLKVRPSGKSRISFLCYSAAVLIFIGYDVWWYATGQTYQTRMGYL
jgi:hypothetical protein